jgi:hypothetical protein
METVMSQLHLQRLIDRAEIADLVSKVGRTLDEHHFDDLEDVFVEDATGTTPGGTASGRASLIDQARRNHEQYQWLQHEFSDVLVEVAGDEATVRANLLGVFGYTTDRRPDRQLGAVYTCHAVRTPDGWRFDAFTVESVWRLELGEASTVASDAAKAPAAA